MNAVKYLHNRFSFAIKNNGTIKVNQQDIEAINKLVENEKERNTDLEDALLLYYLLCTFKVRNIENKMTLEQKPLDDIFFPMGLAEPMRVLEKLSWSLNPKEIVIKNIADEIWIYQEYERLYKDQELRNKELEEIRDNKGIQTKDGVITTFYVTRQESVPIDRKSTYEEIENLINDFLDKAKNDLSILTSVSKGMKWKS